jgi:cytochrome c oxidase assembly protein subunit 15
VTGTLPPLSDADWTETFDKYKDSPEYRLLNPNMTLDEFKFIYYMEWGHRIWGRAIGLTFVLPAAYFTLRRRVTPKIARRLLGISALIGFQGLIGWWMVKSGLREDLFAKPGSHPRVSQYRLTTHLGAAFTVYAAMLWSGLDILRDNRLLKNDPQNAVKAFQSLCVSQLRVFRGLAGFIVAMVFTTAMTGGLVAGLDAGLIYNEFPKMGTGYIPPRNELMKPYYSQKPDLSDLWWRNQLENPTMVQFQHRVAAVSTYAAILAVFAYSRFNPAVVAAMPLAAKKTMHTVMALASCQVALGIGTLIYMVPIHLAATHQAGALALLTASIVLTHRISLPKAAARIAARRIQTAPIAFKGI